MDDGNERVIHIAGDFVLIIDMHFLASVSNQNKPWEMSLAQGSRISDKIILGILHSNLRVVWSQSPRLHSSLSKLRPPPLHLCKPRNARTLVSHLLRSELRTSLSEVTKTAAEIAEIVAPGPYMSLTIETT
jgi:hypothetical protein